MIVDAHTHVFDVIWGKTIAGEIRGESWGQIRCGEEMIHVLPPYGKDVCFTPEILAQYLHCEGIDCAVLLQGCFFGNQNAITRYATKHYPHLFAGALYVEPWRKDAVEMVEQNEDCFSAVKLECSVATGFCGIREGFNLGEYLPLFRCIEQSKMVLVLDLGAAGDVSYQTTAVKQILHHCPDLTVVICHLAQPRANYLQEPSLLKAWKEQLELSRLGKVYFDTASLPVYFLQQPDGYDAAKYFFATALEIAGTHRIMTGSDMPGNALKYTYRELLTLPALYGRELGLKETEIAAIIGNTAYEVYFK